MFSECGVKLFLLAISDTSSRCCKLLNAICVTRESDGSKPAIKDFNSCAMFAPFVRNGINARRNRDKDERRVQQDNKKDKDAAGGWVNFARRVG